MANEIMFNFWIKKILISFPVSFFVLTEEMKALVLILAMLVLIDTVLGTWVKIKVKQHESKKMRKFCEKVGLYAITLLSFFLVSNMEIYGMKILFLFSFTAIYLNLTEFWSITEKLAYLGVKLPMRFIGAVNERFNINEIKTKEDLAKYLRKIEK